MLRDAYVGGSMRSENARYRTLDDFEAVAVVHIRVPCPSPLRTGA